MISYENIYGETLLSYFLRLESLDHSGCDGRRCSSRRPFYTHVGSNQAQTTRLTCCLDEPAESAPSVTAV